MVRSWLMNINYYCTVMCMCTLTLVVQSQSSSDDTHLPSGRRPTSLPVPDQLTIESIAHQTMIKRYWHEYWYWYHAWPHLMAGCWYLGWVDSCSQPILPLWLTRHMLAFFHEHVQLLNYLFNCLFIQAHFTGVEDDIINDNWGLRFNRVMGEVGRMTWEEGLEGSRMLRERSLDQISPEWLEPKKHTPCTRTRTSTRILIRTGPGPGPVPWFR